MSHLCTQDTSLPAAACYFAVSKCMRCLRRAVHLTPCFSLVNHTYTRLRASSPLSNLISLNLIALRSHWVGSFYTCVQRQTQRPRKGDCWPEVAQRGRGSRGYTEGLTLQDLCPLEDGAELFNSGCFPNMRPFPDSPDHPAGLPWGCMERGTHFWFTKKVRPLSKSASPTM